MTTPLQAEWETQSREIRIVRVFDAPRELVWQMWTEPEHLAKWWGPEGFTVPFCESDTRVGGEFRMTMRSPDGMDMDIVATFLEVDPPSRLVSESQGISDAGEPIIGARNSITFVDLGDGRTELTLVARAEALVPDAVMALGGMEAGWNQSLQCLDDVLSGVVDRQVVLMRLVQAPRELVFEVFTKEEHLAKWFGPTGFTITTHAMDFRVGGVWDFTMHGPDGVDYPNIITYRAITPPSRMEFVHGPEPEFDVTLTLDDFMGTTALTWRCVFVTAAERDRQIEEVGAIEGGNQTFDRLTEYVATLVPAES